MSNSQKTSHPMPRRRLGVDSGCARILRRGLGTSLFLLSTISLLLATPACPAASVVAAWGSNSYGQTNVPPGLTNVVSIAGGAYHSLALKADGTVVGWGSYWNGQNY